MALFLKNFLLYQMHNFYKNSENGAALLLALFVSSIVSIIGYGLFSITNNTSNLEKKHLSEQQAFLTVLSLESFSMNYMDSITKRETITLATNGYDAYSPINIPLERGNAEAQINDLSDCFNINLLVRNSKDDFTKEINQEAVYFFENLLKSLTVSESKANEVSSSLIDWIDVDDFPDEYNGGEDSHYLSLKDSYTTSNQYMQDITELRKVKGITEMIYKKIEPYICALPISYNKININALSPLNPNLLIALTNNKFSEAEAIQFLENRPFNGYDSREMFLSSEIIKSSITSKYAKSIIGVNSNYFNLKTEIIFDEYTFIMNSRLLVEDKKMKIQSRKIGNYL
ncbi:type II secretion system minor pseudopilin GspK [SAR86 cluster bacterium]|jgi:general secretion pathway protein K|nr:type II secretion system minor pseudopilin GspK [SAR86 cluster bacterium]